MPSEDPAIVQIQLGITLRELRERAERTAAEAARHLDCSPAKISKAESGKQGIGADDVASLIEFYGADDSEAAEALRLASVPRPRRRRGSRSTYREAVPHYARRYLALEADASDICAYDGEVITGLLHTPDYARALIRAATPYAGNKDIEPKVDLRMRRQELLTRTEPAPLQLDVILHESALHRVIGDDACMRGQLDHLSALAELPNVRLQILAFRPRPTPNHDEAFVAQTGFRILRLPERGSLVYIEDFAGGMYPEDATVIAQYAQAFERLRSAAEPPEDSRALIGKIAKQYT